MTPSTFNIGPFPVHLYGLILGLAMITGGSIAAHFAPQFSLKTKSSKLTADKVWDSFFWAIIFGIIGARLYHVIDLWDFYSQNPSQIFALWNGGLGIFGAIAGGVIGFWLYATKNKLPLLSLLDLTGIALPISQAIGRFGNFVNQELYGKPTQLPWKIYIDPQHRLPGYENFNFFHPLFAYEALANLCLFGLLYLLFHRRILKPNQASFFAVYLFGYSFIRYWLEPLRLDSWTILFIPTAQLVALLLMVLSLLWLFLKPKKVS